MPEGPVGWISTAVFDRLTHHCHSIEYVDEESIAIVGVEGVPANTIKS